MIHVLAEIPFFSLQGEGIHAGRPSIFVRYAGCNLRCQFGLKCKNCKGRDIPSNIQKVIDNIDKYNNIQELPVFPNYCDTYVGILPEFSKFWKSYTTNELVNEIISLVKDNENYKDLTDVDIVFTGGEPMLFQNKMFELISELRKYNLHNVTIETNGTIPLDDNIFEKYGEINDICFTFSVSPKISSANYTMEQTCKPEALDSYSRFATDYDYVILKFVVQSEDDIPVLLKFVDKYKEYECYVDDICLMPCGGKADPGFDKMQELVWDLCVKYNFRFSPRLQMIKKNAWAV